MQYYRRGLNRGGPQWGGGKTSLLLGEKRETDEA